MELGRVLATLVSSRFRDERLPRLKGSRLPPEPKRDLLRIDSTRSSACRGPRTPRPTRAFGSFRYYRRAQALHLAINSSFCFAPWSSS